MSYLLRNDLRSKGAARVLVFLKEEHRSRAQPVLDRFVNDSLAQPAALASAAGRRATQVPEGRYYPNLGICLGSVNRTALDALRAHESVLKVTGAPMIRPIRPVSAARATLRTDLTWGLSSLRIKSLWDQGLNGEGVKVGHLDTGVDGKHPSLRKAIGAFAEFDDFGNQIQPDPRPHDSDDHGTHTAGTIAGRAVRGRSIGVAPGALLCSAMVIEGGDAVARVLGGMDWAVGQGVRVLSMSLGFPGYVDDFLGLTRILRRRGILPVFAVGNEGPGTSRSPGNYSQALSVGASDARRRVARFSSSDRFSRKKDPIVPDVVAPGVDVISASPEGEYQTMSGSSMATPHVAGLAALLWQARPGASVDEIEGAIFRSCRKLDGSPVERQGKGLPDAPAALKELMRKDPETSRSISERQPPRDGGRVTPPML